MGIFPERSWNYQQEHYKLDHKNGKVFCVHCKKVMEERDHLPDYGVFMGSVWAKRNLPCEPYERPTEETK